MSNYLVELSIVHLSLIVGYWFFLKNENQYAKMRAYFIGSTLVALVIPLLKLPDLISMLFPDPVQYGTVTALPLAEVSVVESKEVIDFESLALVVYFLVCGILLIKFIYNVLRLVALERSSRYEKMNDLFVRKVTGVKGSFTFFHWIFLDESVTTDQKEYQAILRHEHAHVVLGHSYDLILIELFTACFWWLPSAWYIRNEIKKIHEFQADAYALRSYSIDWYSSILISSSLKSNGMSLASSFHDDLIFKRLKAMKQNATRLSPWKWAVLATLGVGLVIGFACSEQTNQDIKKIGEQGNAISFDQLPGSMQEELTDIKDELVFTKVEITESDESANIEKLQGLDKSLIYTINVDDENKFIYIALKKEDSNFDYVAEKSKTEGEVFTVVEKVPEYPGGMEEFFKYLAAEIRYPKEARQKGIAGRVYVQFVVEKDGSVSEVKTLKGIGGGCDEEAVRVLLNSPAFNPGMQRGMPVRVRMVLPVIFELSETARNVDGTAQGAIVVEEVRPENGRMKVDASYSDGEWSGTVYDEAGNVLPGVNVVVSGTTTGTVSDLGGNFKVSANESQKLHVSFVGYESVQLQAD